MPKHVLGLSSLKSKIMKADVGKPTHAKVLLLQSITALQPEA